MHTQCPHCKTIFRINAAHLNVAQGYVRCSHCQSVFNAASSLLKPADQQPHPGHPADFTEADFPEFFPDDLDTTAKTAWGRLFFWGIITIVLLIALAGQMTWFIQRDVLLQHAQLRPWLERFCHTFLCVLPPTRDLDRIEMQEHVVQVDPETPDVIQFEALFVNQAYFPQPYPELQLTFEDNSGLPIAQRRFKPSEYLSSAAQMDKTMTPGIPVHIKLQLTGMANMVEENKVVKGYKFDFF